MIKNYSELLNGPGGAWLGVAREFIQWKAINGEEVRWGSHEQLRFASLSVSDIEALAARVAFAALNELPLKNLIKDLEFGIATAKQLDPTYNGKWFAMQLRLDSLKENLPYVDDAGSLPLNQGVNYVS